MKTQTIEVEGLPEGWKAVAYRVPVICNKEHTLDDDMRPMLCTASITYPVLIVEKIQPRRIVLEETDEVRVVNPFEWFIYGDDGVVTRRCKHTPSLSEFRIWREVNETNEEPQLCLTKKDMLELIEHIKLGGRLNPKIAEFIDYEQPDPKLSLSGFSVQECQSILGIIETFSETFGCWDNLVSACKKLREFIKENS